MTIWEAFKAGFGFLSVIPVGITMEGIEALMKRLYMYPIVGFCLGILIGIITFAAEIVLPTPLTIIAIMLATYGIIWFNHLDGVSDMGDGMTAHGSLEKKRKALKDMSLGIGGVAFAVLLMLLFYSSLAALENISTSIGAVPYAGLFSIASAAIAGAGLSAAWTGALTTAALMAIVVTVAETNGKQAMLTIATFGKSFSEGLGSMTIAGGTRRNFTIGILFTAVISTLLLGFLGIAALIISTIAALIILKISNRHFEGLNGDGIGTANEVGRIITIASIAVILFLLYGGMFWTL
ncbi:Adenosylcobinamide-GDP ribazoletransferase [Methanimicrococcus hongohii]|uniref:Adenosylcobinamide-GDP ribazoletransferase n=1 Tax=Methanimicrococcus hongohii TaxID=3028295 RepID=A0AA96V1Y6_9EURY|nr:adenosylcobinamide-GDP ribazoletransferase [Methanimicrococcus sp. Hf6]WNY24370.1 Adenosylcobinamide-GDP ribazoletransferase [Methanimicrococcus sp. Hf6]